VTRRPWRSGRPWLAWLAAPAVAGCALNEPIGLEGVPALPALADSPDETDLDGTPSLAHGLDRQGWPAVNVGVPTHQVSHLPTYVSLFRWDHDRGPWSPAYPSAVGSVVDATDAGADVADASFQPVWAALLLAWSPIDMVTGNWPWVVHRSPTEDYAVLPATARATMASWFDLPEGKPKMPVWNAPAE